MILPGTPMSRMRAVLALVLVSAFGLALFALYRDNVPADNRETLTYMLGQLSGMVTTGLAFYFSTSQSSVEKSHVIAGMAADSTTVRPVEVVNRASDPVPVEVPRDVP